MCEKYSNQYSLIFCDEFQDADILQFEMLCLLGRHTRITACGDEDQSIYLWRGSNVKIFDWFRQEYPGCNDIFLTQTYRSTGILCRAVNAIISNNKNRAVKTMWTQNCDGDLIELLLSDNPLAEAENIVKTLLNLRNTGVLWAQMAVLSRTRKIATLVENILKRVL